MTRVVLTIVAAALAASAASFDQRLASDQQIVHALNRLTFGPRPGDVEEVRRIGLTKWIELQLHPEQITENPVLEDKLKPLESLRQSLPDVVTKYTPEQNMGMMMMVQNPFDAINKLSQTDRMKVMNGTAEERTAVLDAMDPETRTRVLAATTSQRGCLYAQIQRRSRKGAESAAGRTCRLRIAARNPQLRDLLTRGPAGRRRARAKKTKFWLCLRPSIRTSAPTSRD